MASSTPFPMLFLRSMRPSQWTKNLLLFAGVIFSHNLGNMLLLGRAALGFLIFSVLSGTIYIINDIADRDQDRLHPVKRERPIAAELLKPGPALAGAVLLAPLALACAFLLNQAFAMTAIAYLVITLFYTHVFKHVAVVDIILLALGFVLRAIAGVFVIRVSGGPEIPMTPWFVVCVMFLALFIAVCKRRHERVLLNEGAAEHRQVLAYYPETLLDQMTGVSAAATIISYALYLVAGTDGTLQQGQDLRLLSTLPFVIYGIFRYLLLVHAKDGGGEPHRLILKDRPLLINTIAWLLIMIFLHRQ